MSRRDDDEILVGAPFAHIPPGTYQARSVDYTVLRVFDRKILRLDFDVFHGGAADGHILARVPAFYRVPDGRGRMPSGSKLFRTFQLLGVPLRHDRLHPRQLIDKLWEVEIGDVTESAEIMPETRQRRRLAGAQVYSVVRWVLERLA